MNEPLSNVSPRSTEPPIGMSPWVLIGAAVVFLLLVLAGMLGGSAGLIACFSLAFGWLTFLSRGLSNSQPDGPSLALGVGACGLLFGLLHACGRRCSAQRTDGRWTWRSTTITTGLFLAFFVGGVAMIGVTHQLLWLVGATRTFTVAATPETWPDPPDALNLVGHARRHAQMSQSRNQLKMIGMALLNYHDSYSTFPPGVVLDAQGHARHGWTLPLSGSGMMMSYIDYDWRQEPWDGPRNIKLARGAIPEFVNPLVGWHGQFDEQGLALMHYAGNVRVFPINRSLRIGDICDGTSNTLCVGEVAERFQPWASPWNVRDPIDGINTVPWGFGGPPGQNFALFLLCDGSVRPVRRDLDPRLLKYISTPCTDDEDLKSEF